MSDPYSANTVLLVHMEGTNGSTSFVDSSGFSKSVAVNGDAQISTAQSKWGNGSGYFDGNGDYLGVPDGLSLTDNDFTVEAWIYVSSLTEFQVIASSRLVNNNGYNYWLFIVWPNGTLELQTRSSSGTQFRAQSNVGAITTDQWHFVAGTRSSGVLNVFVDGVIGPTTVNDSNNNLAENTVAVGLFNYTDSVVFFNGYMQDFRLTKGVARYTATFTPPSAKLPDPDPPHGRLLQPGVRCDIEDGGAYRITGNVDELGVYGSYRVRLFDRQSGRCLRETWSAADGSYSFPYIAYRYQGYFAVAFDHGDNPLNAAIADLITPELMP